MRLLRRNLGYKILSLFIAILLYYVAYTQQNPRTTREVFVIPEVVNLPDSLIVKVPPEGNIVTVFGPQPALDLLRSQSITARVDASRAREGENRLPVTYTVPEGLRSRVRLEGTMIALVVVTKKERRDYAVDPIHDLTPPIGFDFKEPIVEPRQVFVEGLPSDVARVWRVVASVEAEPNQSGAIDRVVPLVAQDVKQKVVDTVAIDPPQARVQIGLKRTPATKMVLLSADMQGEPAEGYYVAGYEFQPRMVTIAGPQEALDARSSLSLPVDIEGISRTQTKIVALRPPPGITLREAPQTVRVLLKVRAMRPGANPAASPTPAPTPASGGAASGSGNNTSGSSSNSGGSSAPPSASP